MHRHLIDLCGYWDQSTDLGVKPGQRAGNRLQDLGAQNRWHQFLERAIFAPPYQSSRLVTSSVSRYFLFY